MKLEDIGFYTLSDQRAKTSSQYSPIMRGEILITDRCNFKCPYCRGIREDCRGIMSEEDFAKISLYWEPIKNIRFSGGEPTLHPNLIPFVLTAKYLMGADRIAISTNGSADLWYYKALIAAGVNDFSISLDACCAAKGQEMAGVKGLWEKTITNIRELSKLTYVTVGMVFTPDNVEQATESVIFAHSLGVSDIRVISSAQYNQALSGLSAIPNEIREAHPILNYRLRNFESGRNVRGIRKEDTNKCPLVLDDSAIAGDSHFPCIIYLREQGNPIGRIHKNMRQERYEWFLSHDTHKDQICKNNCLDVCVDFNNAAMRFHEIT